MKDAVAQKRNNNVVAPKSKPSLEIYRPPGVRTDVVTNPQLNVHAKEFTMKQNDTHLPKNAIGRTYHLQHSKSSGNLHRYVYAQQQMPFPLQHQVSFTNVPHHQTNYLPFIGSAMRTPHALNTSSSSGNILHSANRVHFSQDHHVNEAKSNAPKPGKLMKSLSFVSPSVLKRSKSFNADVLVAKSANVLDTSDVGQFSPAIQATLEQAIKDPNVLKTKTVMDLCREIVDRVIEDKRYAIGAAKICITIIEKDRKETFLETLLNLCQQWYYDRGRHCHDVSEKNYSAFMTFCNEMYSQDGRRKHSSRSDFSDVALEVLFGLSLPPNHHFY